MAASIHRQLIKLRKISHDMEERTITYLKKRNIKRRKAVYFKVIQSMIHWCSLAQYVRNFHHRSGYTSMASQSPVWELRQCRSKDNGLGTTSFWTSAAARTRREGSSKPPNQRSTPFWYLGPIWLLALSAAYIHPATERENNFWSTVTAN